MLSSQKIEELSQKFFPDSCYGIEDDVLFLDGHVSISTILRASDWIREEMKNESDNRLKDGEFDDIEKEAIEDWKSNHKLAAIRTLKI